VSGACQRASQVILRIGMRARELGAAQTQNRFHPGGGRTLAEQFFGDPEVRDTPIGLWKALWNLQVVQPALINGNLDGLEDEINRCRSGWSSARLSWTEAGNLGALGRSERGRFQQPLAVGCQAGAGVAEFDPGRQAAGQAPSRLLIGESGKSAQMTPICTGAIGVVEGRQVASDVRCQGGRQRHETDPNPGLQMSRAGLDHATGLMTVGAHVCQYLGLGIVEVDKNIACILVKRVGAEVDVEALAVASTQKSKAGFAQNFDSRPKPLAWPRPPRRMVDQADQISVTRHGRKLSANGLQRKKGTNIRHGGSTSSKLDRSHGIGSAAKGALYRETLQATGRTTRIVIAPREFAPILSDANSVASACNPPGARFLAGDLNLPWPLTSAMENRNFLLCSKAELSTLP